MEGYSSAAASAEAGAARKSLQRGGRRGDEGARWEASSKGGRRRPGLSSDETDGEHESTAQLTECPEGTGPVGSHQIDGSLYSEERFL